MMHGQQNVKSNTKMFASLSRFSVPEETWLMWLMSDCACVWMSLNEFKKQMVLFYKSIHVEEQQNIYYDQTPHLP